MATVRQALLWADVITAHRPRTDVERWQIQDRLVVRLRQIGVNAPRFFESAGGRLAFRVRVGWRLPADLRRHLECIDEVAHETG